MFERENLKLIKENKVGTASTCSLLAEEMEARSIAEF